MGHAFIRKRRSALQDLNMPLLSGCYVARWERPICAVWPAWPLMFYTPETNRWKPGYTREAFPMPAYDVLGQASCAVESFDACVEAAHPVPRRQASLLLRRVDQSLLTPCVPSLW